MPAKKSANTQPTASTAESPAAESSTAELPATHTESTTCSRSRRRLLTAISTAAMLSTAGCLGTAIESRPQQGDRSADSDRQPSQTVTYSADSPTAESTVTMGGDHDNRFSPQLVWIETGGTVTWRNIDPNHDHDVVVLADRRPADGPQLSSDLLAVGESVDRTFDTPGIYDYVCTPHASRMVGRVIVGHPDPGDQPALSVDADGLAGDEAAAVVAVLDDRTTTLLAAADCDCPA